MNLFRKLTAIVALCFIAVSVSIAEEYEEGVHYERVVPAQPTSTVGKVEVLELFWYGCPHCFRFEPYIDRWLKKVPENVQFVRMPGVFRSSWENHARAFYTAQLLGVFDKVHEPLFNAIHVKKKSVDTMEDLRDFFAEHAGVDKNKFIKTFKSFAVETRLKRAKTMGSRYAVRGVPAVIVNGKYRVPGGSAESIKIINYLIEKESS